MGASSLLFHWFKHGGNMSKTTLFLTLWGCASFIVYGLLKSLVYSNCMRRGDYYHWFDEITVVVLSIATPIGLILALFGRLRILESATPNKTIYWWCLRIPPHLKQRRT